MAKAFLDESGEKYLGKRIRGKTYAKCSRSKGADQEY